MKGRKKLTVSFFQRKPRPVGNYSLEFIFHDVRTRLAEKIQSKVVYSTFPSNGIIKRLYNSLEVIFKQSEVNHITGDVHYLAIFLRRRKTILTVHDCVFLTNSTGLKHRLIKYFWLTLPVKKAAYITAISQSTKDEILRHTSYPPERIKIIHVAISDIFKRTDKVFNKQQPRILQIGTAPNKNLPRLIEALKGVPCTLDIVGQYNPDYELLLKSAEISYEYRWNLTDDEIIRKYENADILAFTSTYEGFGMPILEAQAIGRAVITSNVYSMPEVAGDAACLADPLSVESIRNGILKIISDDEYRNTIVSNGFANVKRFDADRIASQYFELYSEVASNI